MPRRALAALVFVASVAAACSDPAPRMHVTRNEVSLGDPVGVHLEDTLSAPRSPGLWLTLAPIDAPDSFAEGRVLVEPSTTHASVPSYATGRFEVRLHDDFPHRPHHVIARAKVDVVIESASATFMSK